MSEEKGRPISVTTTALIVLIVGISIGIPITVGSVPSAAALQTGSPCSAPSVADIISAPMQPSTTNGTVTGTVLPKIRNGTAKPLLQQPPHIFTLRMQLVFKIRNQVQFEKCLAAINDPSSPDYGHFLNATTLEPYVPTPTQKSSIMSFFTSKGFTVKEAASPLVIELSAPVKNVERAFGISIAFYKSGNVTFYATGSDPVMPKNFALLTEGILGLDNSTKIKTLNHPSSLSYQCWGDGISPYCPPALQVGYSLTTLYGMGYDGTGQNVAITMGNMLGCCDTDPQTAINTFSSEFSLPQTTLTILYPDGPTNLPLGAEEDLDIQSVHSIAPGAHIIVVLDNDLFNAIDYVATNHIAPIVSNSWVLFGCDTDFSQSSLMALDSRLAIDAALGLTMLFGSGDWGARPTGGTLCAMFPASDPNVLSVGGTDLSLIGCSIFTCLGYGSENGWSGSGGGYSGVFSEPSWQSSTIGVRTGRAVPDVSMLGGNPGVWFYHTQLGWDGVTGTSLSTPLWAGFLAIVLQIRGGRPMGNIGPVIYKIGSGPSYSSTFHDVTAGSNGYSAGTGWDAVTGWGSPIANQLAPILAGTANAVLNINLSDAFQQSDNLSRQAGLSRGMSVQLFFNDTLAKGVLKPLTDTSVLIDKLCSGVGKPLTDMLTLADSMSRLRNVPTSISDILNLRDKLLNVFAVSLSFSDTLTLISNLSSSHGVGKPIADVLSIKDIFTPNFFNGRKIVDELNLGESLNRMGVFARGVADTSILNVFAFNDLLTHHISKPLNDTLTLIDSISKMSTLGRSNTDIESFTDYIVTIMTAAPNWWNNWGPLTVLGVASAVIIVSITVVWLKRRQLKRRPPEALVLVNRTRKPFQTNTSS